MTSGDWHEFSWISNKPADFARGFDPDSLKIGKLRVLVVAWAALACLNGDGLKKIPFRLLSRW